MASASYDGNGTLTSETSAAYGDSAETERFVNDRQGLLMDSNYAWIFGPSGPMEQVNQSTQAASFLIADATPSVRAIVGSSGSASSTSYDPFGNQAGAVISNATYSSGTATVTTAEPTSFVAGATVVITGVNPAAYDGTFTVAAAGTTSVSYALSSGPGGYVSGGLLALQGQLATPLGYQESYLLPSKLDMVAGGAVTAPSTGSMVVGPTAAGAGRSQCEDCNVESACVLKSALFSYHTCDAFKMRPYALGAYCDQGLSATPAIPGRKIESGSASFMMYFGVCTEQLKSFALNTAASGCNNPGCGRAFDPDSSPTRKKCASFIKKAYDLTRGCWYRLPQAPYGGEGGGCVGRNDGSRTYGGVDWQSIRLCVDSPATAVTVRPHGLFQWSVQAKVRGRNGVLSSDEVRSIRSVVEGPPGSCTGDECRPFNPDPQTAQVQG